MAGPKYYHRMNVASKCTVMFCPPLQPLLLVFQHTLHLLLQNLFGTEFMQDIPSKFFRKDCKSQVLTTPKFMKHITADSKNLCCGIILVQHPSTTANCHTSLALLTFTAHTLLVATWPCSEEQQS